MSQRETRTKPVSLLQIGGVNQRVRATELPIHEYVMLDGVFPEFAGLQSRLWGKRVLQKYPGPIYGIHQFWTPMGYGGGVYQFDGTVDFGYWLTPNSSFDLTIPPLLGFDGGGMTLDEFGYGYGSNFGYGTDNACVISFLNGSTDHSSCQPEPSPANTPDDNNGGPAGQGRSCRWSVGNPIEFSMPGPLDTEFGVWSNSTTRFEGPTPYPVQREIMTQRPSAYAPGTSPYGNLWYASCSSSSTKTNFGFGNYGVNMGASAQNTLGRLDLSPWISEANVPSLVEVRVRHNGNAPYDYVWMSMPVSAPDANDIQIDVWDYINTEYLTGTTQGGFIGSDFIVLDRIRISYNGRVCV